MEEKYNNNPATFSHHEKFLGEKKLLKQGKYNNIYSAELIYLSPL